MATIKPFANSIWPNALKTDSESYVIFYPLGTNKVDINTVKWPKGDKLITPFMYEGEKDKLVGFVDTESLISGENSIIYLPYNHIEIQFPSIEKGTLQIHAPNATTKKVSWSNNVFEDIPEAQFKYKGCTAVVDVRIVDADFKTNDIVDGVWSEPLWDLEDGAIAFKDCVTLNTFSSDLPSLTNGSYMFNGCSQLTSISSDLSSLVNGEYMFKDCNMLNTFSSDLPSLTDGNRMFYNCSQLTSFSSDLSSLTNGYYMFDECSNLSSFTSDLPSLTNGGNMFRNCTNLTSFSSDLSSLVNGDGMFYSCGNLTSFSSDLSGLVSGNTMFSQCKLDAESVMNVAHSIKNITAEKQLYIDGVIPYVTYDSSTNKYSAPRGFMSDGHYVYTYHNSDSFTTTINSAYVGKLTLAINVTKGSTTLQQLEDFAHEADFDSWADLKQAFVDKGWTVAFQYGGTTNLIIYGLRGDEEIISYPIYAKLVESDKESAEYCTEDSSSFYNIDWGHDVTDTTGYTQFNSLEEAISAYNVIPKN